MKIKNLLYCLIMGALIGVFSGFYVESRNHEPDILRNYTLSSAVNVMPLMSVNKQSTPSATRRFKPLVDAKFPAEAASLQASIRRVLVVYLLIGSFAGFLLFHAFQKSDEVL